MFTGELYPYQVDAAIDIQARERVLVAYSMGLGKTPITIAALEGLYEAEKFETCLIVVPASLKHQWVMSLKKFTDCLYDDICMVGGSKIVRRQCWESAVESSVRYVICSYNVVRLDWDYVSALPFQAMVCDEATALKNFGGKTTKLIKKLQPRYRIALSGAPVENRPEEIYSIMQWVDDSALGRWDYFDKSFIDRNDFGGVRRYKNLDLLHTKLKTSMIRRSRKDPEVAPYLPEVEERDHLVELDPATRRAAKHVEKSLLKALDALTARGAYVDLAAYYAGAPGLSSSLYGVVASRSQILHMLLDHPDLVAQSAKDAENTGNSGSQYAADLMRDPNFKLPTTSPKLAAFEDLARRILEEDESNKIIVFTQYRRMCHALFGGSMRYLSPEPWYSSIYHGGLSAVMRETAIRDFQRDPTCRVLFSTDAGGYGLDLPAANFLINYDLPYSNGKLQQRNTRHVRASSTFDKVYVANLICEDTIEERVKQILDMRGKVADAIQDGLGGGEVANDIASLTAHVRQSAMSL